MIAPQDGLLGHSLACTFDCAGNNGPGRTKRHCHSAHPIDGTTITIDLAIGCYPNRAVLGASAGAATGREQYKLRASRQLGPTPCGRMLVPLPLRLRPARRAIVSHWTRINAFKFALGDRSRTHSAGRHRAEGAKVGQRNSNSADNGGWAAARRDQIMSETRARTLLRDIAY